MREERQTIMRGRSTHVNETEKNITTWLGFLFALSVRLTAIVILLLNALREIIKKKTSHILKNCIYPEMSARNECVSKLRLRQGHQAQSATHFHLDSLLIIRISSTDS